MRTWRRFGLSLAPLLALPIVVNMPPLVSHIWGIQSKSDDVTSCTTLITAVERGDIEEVQTRLAAGGTVNCALPALLTLPRPLDNRKGVPQSYLGGWTVQRVVKTESEIMPGRTTGLGLKDQQDIRPNTILPGLERIPPPPRALQLKEVERGGMTPLLAAVRAANLEMVRSLLARGASVNTIVIWRLPELVPQRPLTFKKKKVEQFAEWLIEEALIPHRSATALHLASAMKDQAITDLLLRSGADASLPDEAGLKSSDLRGPEGVGTVVFYRPKAMGASMRKAEIVCNGENLAKLANGRAVEVPVPVSGAGIIFCELGNGYETSVVPVPVRSGGKTYVRVKGSGSYGLHEFNVATESDLSTFDKEAGELASADRQDVFAVTVKADYITASYPIFAHK